MTNRILILGALVALVGCGAPPPAGDAPEEFGAQAPPGITAGANGSGGATVTTPATVPSVQSDSGAFPGGVPRGQAGTQEGDTASEATEVVEAPVPSAPIKTGLEATDPSSVALGNGKPHLVEFFAFW